MCKKKIDRIKRSMWLVNVMSNNIECVHLSLLVTFTHVFVNIATQIATTLAIRAFESRALSAGIQQMPAKTVLPLEHAIACRARIHPLSGELQSCHEKFLVTWKMSKQKSARPVMRQSFYSLFIFYSIFLSWSWPWMKGRSNE